jgi:chaperonin GroEL (HSP60 family)
VKEIMDLTHAAVPKRLLKMAEVQYNLAGDFTKTAICLAGAWLQFFLDAGLTPRQQKHILRGFHRVVRGVVQGLEDAAFEFQSLQATSPEIYVERNLLQNLSARLSPSAAEKIAHLLAPRVLQWLPLMPQRVLSSSREFLPQVLQTVISPGGQIVDSYLFNGVVLKKEVENAEKQIDLQAAKLLLTQEKLYVEKPDKTSVEYVIKNPADIGKFRAREQIFQPDLPDKLQALGVTILVTEKGIKEPLIEKLGANHIRVIRRAKLKQMTRISKATGARILGVTRDASETDVISSSRVYSEKVRGDWRVFVGLPKTPACALIIRCSDYDVGLEVRRVVKSALRATLCSLHTGKVLPGAGTWQALACNLCREVPGVSHISQDAAQYGFRSLLETLVTNVGCDPIDVGSELVGKNIPKKFPYWGINATSREVTLIEEINVYDSLRGISLAIEHARQFVEQMLLVDEVFYIDRKPHKD